MNVLLAHLRQSRFPLLFTAGALIAFAAAIILVSHIHSFALKRDEAMKLGLTLPGLQGQVSLAKVTLQAEKAYLQQAHAAAEEQAQAFVLPKKADTNRLERALITAAASLKDAGLNVKFGSLSVLGSKDNDIASETQVNVVLSGDRASVVPILSLLDLSGYATVSDIVGDETVSQVLTDVNAMSPESLSDALQFLSTDLLTYASQAGALESRLTQHMSTDDALALRTLLLTRGLAHVRATLAPMASDLKTQRAWPLPLVQIETVSQDDHQWLIGLNLYSR